MFKFLHAADIHLDSPDTLKGLQRYDGAPIENMRQATRRALQNLIELALREQVAFVLIAGDLYDGDWKDYNTGLFFISQMQRLRVANIQVYIIAGNHDAANRMTRSLPLPDHVRLFSANQPDTVLRDDLGVALHGQGFAQAAITEDLSQGYPASRRGYFNIGLLHTCATGREGHERYAPCTLEGLCAKEYDYWALGHVHKREVLREKPWVVFPGNLQGRHIRETDAKGCYLVSVNDRHDVELTFCPLDVMRWEVCSVAAPQANDGLAVTAVIVERLKTFRQAHPLPLAVRIELTGTCPAHADLQENPEHWTNVIRAAALEAGGDIWIEKIHFRTCQETVIPTEGPLAEIQHVLAELRNSSPTLANLWSELKDLADLDRKLPADIKQGTDGLDLQNPECLRGLLDQVEPFLLKRLLTSGGPT